MSSIALVPDKVEAIVLACCSLHTWKYKQVLDHCIPHKEVLTLKIQIHMQYTQAAGEVWMTLKDDNHFQDKVAIDTQMQQGMCKITYVSTLCQQMVKYLGDITADSMTNSHHI